jgi:hypothetical protein
MYATMSGWWTSSTAPKSQALNASSPSSSARAGAPSAVNLQVISTPSAIALHIHLARCDHGRSSSGGGKGDDRGGTSQRSVNPEGSRTARCWWLCPASLHWPRPALPGYEVAYGAQPCASRPAGIGERFRVLRPGGQIAVSDSDYNILTMAISSADRLQSYAQSTTLDHGRCDAGPSGLHPSVVAPPRLHAGRRPDSSAQRRRPAPRCRTETIRCAIGAYILRSSP